jgi:hypothetical protein
MRMNILWNEHNSTYNKCFFPKISFEIIFKKLCWAYLKFLKFWQLFYEMSVEYFDDWAIEDAVDSQFQF